MQILDWTDEYDRFAIKKDYGDFQTEFVFMVDHVKGGIKLERAKKIFTIGSFDLSSDTMNGVFSNILDDATEKYIKYLNEHNKVTVPCGTILKPKTGII